MDADQLLLKELAFECRLGASLEIESNAWLAECSVEEYYTEMYLWIKQVRKESKRWEELRER